MALLDNIRQQPRDKKIRLIWIFAGVTVFILIILWITTAGIRKQVPRDKTIFDTAGRGVEDLRNYKKPNQ